MATHRHGRGWLRGRRALAISTVLTGMHFIVELVTGIAIGSVAVLSDAFHTFSTVGASSSRWQLIGT